MLPSYDEIRADKKVFAQSFYTQYLNTDHFSAKPLVEPYPNHVYVVQNIPQEPLSQSEMQQVPVSIQNPGAKASQAYQRIAERMCEKEDDTAQEQQPRRGMAAFFSHIIGTRNGATKQSR